MSEEIKKLLIIEASDDVCSTEIKNIEYAAAMYNVQVQHCRISSIEDLRKCVETGTLYNYIYLCAHANRFSFGTKDNSVRIAWKDFAEILCEETFIDENTIFLLACCRSGINQVAYELFYSCDLIGFVCGPTWYVSPQALTLAFNTFLYNVEFKKVDPTEAANRMNAATGHEFVFFDKVKTEMEPAYIRHVDMLEFALRKEMELDAKSKITDQLN